MKSLQLAGTIRHLLYSHSKNELNFLRFVETYRQSFRYASYKAAVVNKHGESLKIKEFKKKEIDEDEVRLSVRSCGINSLDQLHIDGKEIIQTPFIPGFEVCGEITEIGKKLKNDSSLKVGGRAIGLLPKHCGGFAGEAVLSRNDIWPVDDVIPFSIGASMINSYATALLSLTEIAKIQPTDTVMVVGAAGRIGLAASDLSANVYRCKVIAVCTTNEKADALRDLGVFSTVVVKKQSILEEVTECTEGAGVSLVIDAAGAQENVPHILETISANGRIIVPGSASYQMPKFDLGNNPKNIEVSGATLATLRVKDYKAYSNGIKEVISLYYDRLIKPFDPTEYDLSDVNDALKHLEKKKSVAKVVLNMK